MSDVSKLSTNLDKIPKLNTAEDYNCWWRTIRNIFVFANLGNVTYNLKSRSTAEGEAQDKYNRNAELAMSCIDKTVYFTAQRMIEHLKTPKEQIDKLRDHFRPRGRTVYNSLTTALKTLSLADYPARR